MNHVNAQDVFPQEIIEEIQKHYSGGYLFIPKPDNKKRDKEICALYKSGEPVKSIAGKMGLSARRIRQILRKKEQGKFY